MLFRSGKDYFDLLSDVYPMQYIRCERTDIRRSYRTVAEVTWDGAPETMFFWDGPAFVSNARNYRTVAKYANGLPMAIMQRRVGLIGCHPEAMRTWYRSKKMAPLYHDGAHFELLREFVRELLER